MIYQAQMDLLETLIRNYHYTEAEQEAIRRKARKMDKVGRDEYLIKAKRELDRRNGKAEATATD